jgi:hypothetical protein
MSDRMFLGLTLVVLLIGASASAGPVRIDEFGNFTGDVNAALAAVDPGPGNLGPFQTVLTYTLPFRGVQGDVQVFEPEGPNSDVLRFNGNFTLVVYSARDDIDNPAPPNTDLLGGTQGLPTMFYGNRVMRTVENAAGTAMYQPGPGEPGFDPGDNTRVFTFASEGMIPEPASLVMGGIAALVGLGCAWCRRKGAAA